MSCGLFFVEKKHYYFRRLKFSRWCGGWGRTTGLLVLPFNIHVLQMSYLWYAKSNVTLPFTHITKLPYWWRSRDQFSTVSYSPLRSLVKTEMLMSMSTNNATMNVFPHVAVSFYKQTHFALFWLLNIYSLFR